MNHFIKRVKTPNMRVIDSPSTCFLFQTMITSVLSSAQLFPVSLFNLVTLDSKFGSYGFGAVPQQLIAILIYISSITSINLRLPFSRLYNFSYHSCSLLPRPIHSRFYGSRY